jgi:putative tricarboxylic transport membrane protein
VLADFEKVYGSSKEMKNADRISSITILCLCAYFWYKSTHFTKFGFLFPHAVVIALGLLALTLLIVSFFRKHEKVKAFEQTGVKYINIVTAGLLIMAWTFFIKLLGFLVTSVVFFSVIAIMFDSREKTALYLLKKIGVVVATVGFFYFFFSKLLLVPFPKGVLF